MIKRVLILIFASVFMFLHADLFAEQSKGVKEKCDDGLWSVTLTDIQKKLVGMGENPGKFMGRLADLVQFSDRNHQYGEADFESSEMKDHMTHNANLITDTSDNMISFVFNTILIIPKYAIESYFFQTSPAGELRKAFVIRGKVDESSKAIPKSGDPIILDINDPEVRERFDHEMQVWLKGMHRKKKTVAPAQPH